ncbi:unnamed protein product [Gongylonema pulchrum]|uniref:tRNA_int_end_N2 domain-containing protein n=1 Tax=Gongylonema pulchrum TaxID=637853 RepID=A0A183EMG8_9BILA|nr:unnamed protein product [Gongylonema pulchrum]
MGQLFGCSVHIPHAALQHAPEIATLKSELKLVENRVSQNEVRLEDTIRTVEANERVQRSLNVRIYGFDFTRCNVPRPNEPNQFDVTTPAELVRQLMIDVCLIFSPPVHITAPALITLRRLSREFQDVATVALQLRAKGFVAYSTDNRIRVGPRNDSRWYHYTDPAIHSMLNPSG